MFNYYSSRLQSSEFSSRRWFYALSILQAGSDLVNAVHWMPPGTLWAGKLSPWQVGLLGTASTVLGIYKGHKFS